MPRLSFAYSLTLDNRTTNVRQAALVVLHEKGAIQPGPVVTQTWIPGLLEADYCSGNLLTVRLFAPCPIARFDALNLSLSKRERDAIRRFIKGTSRRKW